MIRKYRALLWVVAFFVVLEAMVFVLGVNTAQELERKRETEFNQQVAMLGDQLEEHVNSAVFVLNSLRGLFAASVEVTEEELLTHLNTILVSPENVSIYSISYAPLKSTVLEPCPQITLNALGSTSTDLCNQQKLREAIEVAIEHGQIAVSNSYVAVDGHRKFSFVAPVVKYSPTGAVVDGLIISEAGVEQFFGDIFNRDYLPGIAFDVDSGQETLAKFYFGQPERKLPENNFDKRLAIPVGNRVWMINASSLAEFTLSIEDEAQPLIVYLVGTIFAGLISLLIFFLIHRRQLAHEEALKITAELKESEEKFKLAFENVSDQVTITDPDGIVIYANPAIERTTGYTTDEAIGKKAGKLWGGLMEKSFYEKMWRTIKIEKQRFIGEITNRRKDGRKYIAETKISPVTDAAGKVKFFVGIERDVSKERELEDQLKLQVEKDKAIFASIGEGLISTDQEGKVLDINSSAEAMLGWKLKELVGKSWVKSITVLDENQQPVSDAKRALIEALRRGKTTISSNHYYSRKDRSYFPIAAVVTPVILGGKIIGAIQVFRDITKEREVDRMKTEFVSLASHQLRTPLTAIKWFSELLAKGEMGKIGPKPLEAINNIYASTQRMIALVNDLLNISRLEAGRLSVNPQLIDIKKMIDSLLVELAAEIKEKGLKLTTTVPEKLPKIKTDPQLIEEVLSNLLSNAIKYTPEGGRVNLKVYKKAENLIMEVKDTGEGIAKKDQAQIFGRFYRGGSGTKMNVQGTGLGLYLSKKIMEVLGGAISFESEEGKGTTFRLELPLKGSKAKKGEVVMIGS